MTDVNLKMLKDTDGNAFVPFSTTDAVFKDGTNQTVSDLLDEKQATLVSGTNIKTINNESLLGAGNITVSAEDEIAISTTEPTGNEILWINPNEVPSGIGSYISNTYGTSQEIGYSQEYVNNHFGKSLWTGSFTSGSINVPDLDKYKIIGVVADGVLCIGNKSFGGGIYGIYGGTGNGIVSYRLSNSGTTLSINSNDKGAYNNGTQVAITDIIGIM